MDPEVSAAVVETKPGNLALCQTPESGEGMECLGWFDEDRPIDDIMKPETNLNWRFENGYLRAVGHNNATNVCLGPLDYEGKPVTTLDARNNDCKAYKLDLLKCPDTIWDTQNVFSRDTKVLSSQTTNSTGSEVEETTSTGDRHMQFIINGDGHVQSLAPVIDLKTGKDISQRYPFCLTVMSWKGTWEKKKKATTDDYTQAYLVPCRNDNIYQGKLQQQFFKVAPGSSYESHLFNLDSENEKVLRLAYQIGRDDPSVSREFESFAIKVTGEIDGSSKNKTVFHSDAIAVTGGFLDYQLSYVNFGVAGSMEAHLVGFSQDGLESSLLASTSYEVPESAIASFPNAWTWCIVAFGSIMALYCCIVNANRIVCPRRRKNEQKLHRDSDFTTDTGATMAHIAEMENARFPGHPFPTNDSANWGHPTTQTYSIPSSSLRSNRTIDVDSLYRIPEVSGEQRLDPDNTQRMHNYSGESEDDRNETLPTEVSSTEDMNAHMDSDDSDIEASEELLFDQHISENDIEASFSEELRANNVRESDNDGHEE